METQIACGAVVQVDDVDSWLLETYTWRLHQANNRSYVRRASAKGDTSSRLLHRMVLRLNKGDKVSVDHINGDPLDNRRANLRLCSNSENACNRRTARHNTSGHKGVSWDKSRAKWTAVVTIGGKQHRLGRFADLDEAVSAVRRARPSLHGEFANDG